MLVLVVGVTGNIGQKLIPSLRRRGHQVRGLGRNPQKLPRELHDQLESFVTSKAYWDIPAMEAACAGPVDAVINAYPGSPEFTVEAQMLLLRAAERAGVRVFVASTWNYDWRGLTVGMHESYDPYLLFRRQVELTAPKIKPIYILSGVLAEVFFGAPEYPHWTAKNHGAWNPNPDDGRNGAKAIEYWGDPEVKWYWTSEADAAEFAAAIVERPNAADGGFWTVCSGVHSLPEIAETYSRVRGVEVTLHRKGSIEELRHQALEARRLSHPSRFWEYIGWFYMLHTVDNTWTLGEVENGKLGVQGTSMEDFLRANVHI